ncbi:MAG: outer membrane beta-barrel protein [Bryobacteraceae bacterium]
MSVFLRLLTVGSWGAVVCMAQPFSAGIKGGLPLTDFVNTVESGAATTSSDYVIGPMVELRLPFSLGVEFDALYRHFNYTTPASSVGSALSTVTSSGDWEFPLLAKYRFHGKLARPYVEAGVAWDALSGLKSSVEHVVAPPPPEQNSVTMGFVMGAGIDIHVLVLHIAPEIRFTRWTSGHFNIANVVNSNQNQAEVLVGVTF